MAAEIRSKRGKRPWVCRAGPIGHLVDIGLIGWGNLQRNQSFAFDLLSSGSLLAGEKVQ